jgi:glycerol-3-phosphate dehydrogenase
MGKSYFIGRKKIMGRLPLLKSEGLKGGVVYHDGQFDDSRLAFALAQSSADKGAIVLNYFQVTGLLKDSSGKINGLTARDNVSGNEHIIKANLVINATGVFADSVARMDDPEARPTLRPSQGVHIVLDRSFLQSDSAIMIPKTDDGRVLFAIPWYNEVVIGTTDTPLENISLEPIALEKEIDFILQTAGKYLRSLPLRADILSIYAGLRPLAANSKNPASTKEVSRRHKITLSSSGLLTIIGGKWTTYRLMAEEIINRAIKADLLPPAKCITFDLRLTKNASSSESGRLRIYGDDFIEIKKIITDNPAFGIPLSPDLPYTRAEILWICRNEMPIHLDDVLARRTRSLFLNVKASASIAPEVAEMMATELGYDKEWQKEEIKSFNELVKNYL